jgi:hypothetical protein
MNNLSSCPYCNDEEIELLFNRVKCTTHKCKNFNLQWEQDNGNHKKVGKYRANNIVYDVYYVSWDPGHELGMGDYVLLRYGDDKLDSINCQFEYLEEYRDLMGKDFPHLLYGYDLFYDELHKQALPEIKITDYD